MNFYKNWTLSNNYSTRDSTRLITEIHDVHSWVVTPKQKYKESEKYETEKEGQGLKIIDMVWFTSRIHPSTLDVF